MVLGGGCMRVLWNTMKIIKADTRVRWNREIIQPHVVFSCCAVSQFSQTHISLLHRGENCRGEITALSQSARICQNTNRRGWRSRRKVCRGAMHLLFLGIYCYCAWILPLYYTTQFDPQAITLAHNKNSHSTLWPLPFLTNVLAPYFIMQPPLLFQHCWLYLVKKSS